MNTYDLNINGVTKRITACNLETAITNDGHSILRMGKSSTKKQTYYAFCYGNTFITAKWLKNLAVK